MTLAELAIAGAVIVALGALALPVLHQWRAHQRAQDLAAAGETLLEALAAYQADRGAFPPPGAGRPGGFNLRTLAPLSSEGYLTHPETLLSRMRDGRVAAYEGGPDGFWLLLVDRNDPDVQVVVASTDQFPLEPETWIEGLFLLRGERLERLRAAPIRASAAGRREVPGDG